LGRIGGFSRRFVIFAPKGVGALRAGHLGSLLALTLTELRFSFKFFFLLLFILLSVFFICLHSITPQKNFDIVYCMLFNFPIRISASLGGSLILSALGHVELFALQI
jgi:hypothetical protein